MSIRTLVLVPLSLAALALCPLPGLDAEGGAGPVAPRPPAPVPAPAPAPNPAGPNQAMYRLFDGPCAGAKGAQGITQVRDFTVALDAKFDLDGTRHEGPMRLWLQLPDLYRQEMTMSSSMTTKVMNRGNLYVKDSAGQFRHMNRTPDGATSIKQVQDDMERLSDLTTFLTLEGLKGPGVVFEYEGEKSPSGSYARPDGGTWAKIVRKAAGRPNIYFWLAHTKDAQGVMHATFPGVVRVDGEPASNIPTEDFLLQEWREAPPGQPRPYLFPRKILAFQIRPGQQPLNFLTAIVTDLKINTGIDPTRFEPR
jgi:hypothetical protein